MPKLPDPTGINRQIPTAARGVVGINLGATGRALESLGRTVEGVVGRAAKDARVEREEEQARQSRLQVSKARSEWIKTKAEQSNAYNDDPDYGTISDRYQESLSTRSSEIASTIADPEQRALFEDQVASDTAVGLERIKGVARQKETDFELSELDQDLSDLRNIALEGDGAEGINAANDRIETALELGYLSNTQATNLRQKTATDFAVSRVSLAPATERKALIDGELGKYIPKDKQQQLLKGAGREYSAGLDDYISYLSAGNPDDPELAAKFSEGNVKVFTGDSAPKINEAIADARAFGQAVNEVKTATPEELRILVDREKPSSPEQFQRESRQFNALQNAISQRNKALSNDPAQYVNQVNDEAEASYQQYVEAFQSGDPDQLQQAARNYSAIQRETQEELGIPYAGVQVLPAQMENVVAQQLNDFSQGGEAAALTLNSMKESFGDEWPTVQRQLQSNKKIGSAVRVMSGMDFGPEMINLAEANSVGQKSYKDVIGDDNFKAIKQDSMESLEDFQDTLRGQPGGDTAYLQYKDSIETLAMKYVADGRFDDTDDALEQAFDDILGKRFEFVGSYRVPKEYEASVIEDGVDATIDMIKEGKFELLTPSSSRVLNKEDATAVYQSVLAPSPITSPDGDGILFTDQNGNAILTKNGEPLVVPWDQLKRNVPIEGLFGEEL